MEVVSSLTVQLLGGEVVTLVHVYFSQTGYKLRCVERRRSYFNSGYRRGDPHTLALTHAWRTGMGVYVSSAPHVLPRGNPLGRLGGIIDDGCCCDVGRRSSELKR